jgi:tetratricopeptide (TPR) repeat protein
MRRALALDPNSPYVLYPACQAGWSLRFDSAGHCERWRALRPDDPFAWVNVSGAYKYQRDFPRAIAEAEAAMARHPNDWLAPWLKSHSEMALGRCGDAIASLERALELDPRRTQDVLSIYSAALQCAGRREEAARIAAEIPPVDPKYAPDPNVYLVPYHAARGELELAWRVCEAALARKWFMGYECLASHWLDGMRDDPRFIEQERRVGLSPLPRQLRVDPKLWMRPVRHSENGA